MEDTEKGPRYLGLDDDAEKDQGPIQQLPAEVGNYLAGFSKITDYIALLGVSRRFREKVRLPLRIELDMLRRDFSEKSANDLMQTHIEDLRRTKERKNAAEELKELIGGVLDYSADADEEIKIACISSLIAAKRLGRLWEAYVAAGDDVRKLQTMVRIAAEMGSVEVIEAIVSGCEKAQIKIDLAANNSEAIRLASANGHLGAIALLLAKKEEKPDLYGDIDPAAQDNHAIGEASTNGHVAVVTLLLAKKEEKPELYGAIDPAANNNHAIEMASVNGHTGVVMLLLAKKEKKTELYGDINPASGNNFAVRWASVHGHVEMVRLLLAKKEEKPELYGDIDPADDDNFAIRWASREGHVEMVKFLLAKKEERPDLYGAINPAADDNYAIRKALANGHAGVVELLLAKKREKPELYGQVDLE